MPSNVPTVPTDKGYKLMKVASFMPANNRCINVTVFAYFVRGIIPQQAATAIGAANNRLLTVCRHEPAYAITASSGVNFMS